MFKLPSISAMILVAAATALPMVNQPVLAQQATPDATPPSAAPPAVPATPNGVVATTNNPNLAVSTVKLENGVRTSKIISAAVYNDQNERVGAIDDLIMTHGNQVTMAIVSVGGFLSLGSKLVAVPFNQLHMDGDKVVLPGASKDNLNAMPNFTYG